MIRGARADRSRWLRTVLAFGLLCLPLARTVRAHEFVVLEALAVLRTDGGYQIDLTVDLDALALGVSPATDSAELAATLDAMSAAEFEASVERARDTILRRVRIRFDGAKSRPAISFPELDQPPAAGQGVPSVLGTTARLTGRIPEGANTFAFGASRAFGPLHLTVLDQSSLGGARFVLGPGEDSPPMELGAPPAARDDGATVAARFLILGFEHILPLGLDHILFVLGLFLLSTRLGALLWQVTAFTIAHTATLALSMYGVVSLPSRLVETLIALSIAYVAAENIVLSELKPWRPLLVFVFGLLHGLGFAGALRELSLPRDEFATALVGFNVGVELGQLAVILLAFLALGWFRKRPWYRRAIVVPLSALIGLVGLYWAIQRGFG
jgi:hypothetical protein